MKKVKYLSVKSPKAAELRGTVEDLFSGCPNFHKSGSVQGMRKIYGPTALLIRCGQWIYNAASKPDIYHNWAK